MAELELDNRVSFRTARESITSPLDLDLIDSPRIQAEDLRRILMADKMELDRCRQELSVLDQHSLYIKHHNGQTRFYQSADSNQGEKLISGDEKKINELARREYLEKRIDQLEVMCKRVEKTVSAYEHKLSGNNTRKTLLKLRDAGIDLTRVIFTEEQNRWIDAPYSPNPFNKGRLKNRTNGGIYMRSRAEVLIGNELERRGIPYRYDDLVEVNGPDRENPNAIYNKSYFADFKFPNLRRGISVNEHLGAFHLQGYGDNAIVRINDYDWYHVFKREEIFWTLDSDVLDPGRLDRVIKNMLLPNG